MSRWRSPRISRVALAVAGVAVSGLAIWLVAREVDLAATARALAGADLVPVAAILGVVGIQAALRAHRWRLLLPRRDGRLVPYAITLRAMLAGYLGNAVLPARLGEVVRSGMLARLSGVPTVTVLGSAVVERVIDVLTLASLGVLIVLTIAVPAWMSSAVLASAAASALFLAVLGAMSVVSRRRAKWPLPRLRAPTIVRRWWVDAATGTHAVGRGPQFLQAVGLTLVAWLLDALIFALAAQALGIELSPTGAVLVSVVAVLSTAVPSAPGYVGTFELAAVAAIGITGVVGPPALAFAVLAHVMTLLPLAIGGAIALAVPIPSRHAATVEHALNPR